MKKDMLWNLIDLMMLGWMVESGGILTVAGDLMLFELIVVRVHCIVCIVCDWRSHDYLVVRI